MARPTSPLISRTTAVAATLEIIDHEGLDAFSLPRLARRMGVRAPSLYHHFADRNAVLAAVSRAIVAETVVPRKPDPAHWQDWFVSLSLNFRTAILRHRNASVLLLQFLPRDAMTRLYDDAAAFLTECGVPRSLHVQILNGLETLTLGAAVMEAIRPSPQQSIFPEVDAERMPHLAAALAANEHSAKRLFEDLIRTFLRGVMQIDEEEHQAAD